MNVDGSYFIADTNISGGSHGAVERLYKAAAAPLGAAYDNRDDTGSLTINASGLEVDVGGGHLSLASGANVFDLQYHLRETISAFGASGETYVVAPNAKGNPGMQAVTIAGFNANGAGHDTIDLSAAAFSDGLNGAGALTHNAAGFAVITDTYGDIVTLTGVSTATLLANSADVRFV